MKVYFARHGQTRWNAENKVCGMTDLPLTDIGQLQARELAKVVKNLKIDMIIASPLKRALETAMIVSEECGIPVITDGRLTEQDFGDFEGIDRFNPAFMEAKKQFAERFPKGESIAQVIHRVYGLLDEVKEKYSHKNILFVCHGGVCRAARTYFKNMTVEEYASYSPDNASVVEYEL